MRLWEKIGQEGTDFVVSRKWVLEKLLENNKIEQCTNHIIRLKWSVPIGLM